MASNDDGKLSPSKKHQKMEATDTDETPCTDDVDDDDDEPLLNNLEHFPIEILLHIFTYTDDIGLLNLAINSCRFEKIAKIVFAKRYADKYFIIDDESKEQQEIYEEQFSRFGSGIRAIKAIDIEDIAGNHWMAQMIHKHIGSRLQKLHFYKCTFRTGCDMLANHMNITHLTIIDGYSDDKSMIQFPQYQNLKKLELRNFLFMDKSSLIWIFRNNPQLESLILYRRSCVLTLSRIMKNVHNHLKHLKEFIVMADSDEHSFLFEGHTEMFLQVTGDLESLGLAIEPGSLDLYRRLGSTCGQNIKNLELLMTELKENSTEMNQMIASTRLFLNVETLTLQSSNALFFERASFLSIIESLPAVRHLYLYISSKGYKLTSWVLQVFAKCENLEKLVITMDTMVRAERLAKRNRYRDVFHDHLNAHFHSEFLKTKHKENVVIELIERKSRRTIGRVTEKEIIWRNTLVHWIGHDPLCSASKVNLLDLADQKKANNEGTSQSEQKSPFDFILDHLDLNSLYALHECSTRSKQLVDGYVRRQSEHGGTFSITDKFFLNLGGLKQFASHVRNLQIKFVEECLSPIISKIIEKYFKNLTKLCVYTHYRIELNEFMFPSVRRYIFYGRRTECPYHCDITLLSEKCTDLKVLEIYAPVLITKRGQLLPSFPNLKVFKFKPYNYCQANLAIGIFARNGTEIVLVD